MKKMKFGEGNLWDSSKRQAKPVLNVYEESHDTGNRSHGHAYGCSWVTLAPSRCILYDFYSKYYIQYVKFCCKTHTIILSVFFCLEILYTFKRKL